jgi:hypothetical protein
MSIIARFGQDKKWLRPFLGKGGNEKDSSLRGGVSLKVERGNRCAVTSLRMTARRLEVQ